MSKFYEIMLISTSVAGFYVSVVLMFMAKQNRLLNRLLSIYTMTSSVYFLLIYAMLRGWGEAPVVLVRTFSPTSLINSAIGYLYFRALLKDQSRLSKLDMIHALPFTLNLAYFSPLALDLLTGKLPLNDVVDTIKPQTFFLPYGPVPEQFIMLFRLCIGTFYIAFAVHLFFKNRSLELWSQLKNLYPNTVRWIMICLGGYVLFGGSVLLNQSRILYSDLPYSLTNGGPNAMAILIGWNIMIVYVLMNPEILYGLPQFAPSVPASRLALERRPGKMFDHLLTAGHAPTSGISPTELAQRRTAVIGDESGLGDSAGLAEPEVTAGSDEQKVMKISEAARLLLEQIHAYIDEYKPYRNQQFNIASLSEALGVPQHHVAFIFKQVLRRSFVEHRNEMRVERVKKSIRLGKHKEVTLEAIGMDAGFTSKATFFAVFKDVTGKTPGQYAAEYR